MEKTLPKSKAENAYELLGDVCALILEEPKRYYQGVWRLLAGDASPSMLRAYTRNPRSAFPACGTVCCVAGWVTTLKTPSLESQWHVEHEAMVLLGLTPDLARGFFSEHAIERTAKRLHRAVPRAQTKAYARLGVAHIRAFMRKHEARLKAKAV